MNNNINERLTALEEAVAQLKSHDALMTAPEAAKFLSITVQTVYRKAAKGDLPYMRDIKRLYFSRAQIIEYLKTGRKEVYFCPDAVSEYYAKENDKALSLAIPSESPVRTMKC